MREILIVAGEVSGDMHGAALAEQLRVSAPGHELTGVGGARMEAAGVQLFARTTGIVGFVEVLRHLPAQLRLLSKVRERLRQGDVALAILIDYGGFNLRAAAAAHAAGVPVLYYITPQVWASRAGRLKTMARVITKAAVIFPFEERLLRDNGVDATFVGHPLLDRAAGLPSRAEARRRLGLSESDEVLALFPGSRAQEIARHLDDFKAVASELERRRPGLKVVMNVAPTVSIEQASVPFQLAREASFDVLRAADVALCKSGTTTLEAAIAGCPCAVVYRINPLTYSILKRMVHVRHIGLVNIVAGRSIAPEFVQDDFVPLRVADALDPLFERGSPERIAMESGLAEVAEKLGDPGASARVASMAAAMLR
ncbi:MAG: lipid-A-disaccharide synthase [Gemmatimonadetes bacterium]|nr:lipid-A-disaccharide synthase [Gemmatimonadota bacterium]